MRGKILEYQRQIVEPKLQALDSKQATITQQLKASYLKARRDFRSRGKRILSFPARDLLGEEQERKEAPAEFTDLVEIERE
ncbi:hypothetical protein [Nitrosococcus watsonii]|uniref:hypothetical protein n=1 Tax=Nitrosococcus watsonii TaxID=473531 RepID=UPI0002DA4CC1|nr:hypothetical protein [Nitrosococcus watsonii]